MKKHLPSLSTVILAISLSAFGSSTFIDIYEYRPPFAGDYSWSSVEDENNWELIGNGSYLCPTTDERACSILVLSGNNYDHDGYPGNSDRLMPYDPFTGVGVDLRAMQGYDFFNYLINPVAREYSSNQTLAADNKHRTIP